ncbi:MAG: hypothetical protein QOJ65_2669, partial [Fimbriimonadaceae bacterium]|nr:hypothetical protein [Fimbriimonadaceae bacterium]
YKQELRRRHGNLYRAVDIGVGCALIVVGLVIAPFPGPGPGVIIIGVGLALIAGESERVARGMDRGEKTGRAFLSAIKGSWRRASLVLKSVAALAIGSLAAAAGYVAYVVIQGLLR